MIAFFVSCLIFAQFQAGLVWWQCVVTTLYGPVVTMGLPSSPYVLSLAMVLLTQRKVLYKYCMVAPKRDIDFKQVLNSASTYVLCL